MCSPFFLVITDKKKLSNHHEICGKELEKEDAMENFYISLRAREEKTPRRREIRFSIKGWRWRVARTVKLTKGGILHFAQITQIIIIVGG
jgi:hypothetical protein